MDKIVNILKRIGKSKWFRVVAIIVIIFIVANVALSQIAKQNYNKYLRETTNTALSERRDIQSVLSSSGTVQPLNTYEVKTLLEGEIIAADFEEGDVVKKGDILYQITTDIVNTKIDAAKTSLERAEKNYNKAVKKYNDALKDYEEAKKEVGDTNVKSEKNGVITKLYVKEGDSIQPGTQIGTIYDNSYMLLTVPFLSHQVKSSWVGMTAKVEIDGSPETLTGTVTKVSKVEKVLTGNQIVRDVTIKVKNPGGITTQTIATASINNIDSNDEGTFAVLEESTITAVTSGKISSLKIEEGDYVKVGTVLFVLNNKSIDDQLKSYETAVEAAKDNIDIAKDSIEDAKLSLDEQKDNLSDYNIEAPISGQIVRKVSLEGDTIKSTSANSTLCVIYDLSALIFKMNIDELDINKIEIGQKVKITVDALEGDEFTGEIINISLESSTTGGVTQYPVSVRIDEVGDLLPGMNVTGEIITDEVTDVIAVPVDALMRGNVVYVKDESVKEAVGEVPIGFREVKVETGLSDEGYIEIKKGLDEDVEVYVVRASGGLVNGVSEYGEDTEGGPRESGRRRRADGVDDGNGGYSE